jgi:group I intron endonuclease
MGWIYLITNNLNGKCYVGQTRRNVEARWKQHKWSVNLTSDIGVLQRALRCHGVEKFSFEIICEVPNEDLDSREIQEIAERDTLVPNGYNLQKGGGNSDMHETTKKKIGEANKGEKSYLFGKVYTNEEKEQMMLNSPLAKKVNQYTLDEKFIKTWTSVSQVRRELGKSVTEVCNGVRKTCGGFKWTWYTGSEEYEKPQVVQEQLEKRRIRDAQYREKNKEYIKAWHQEWYKRLKNNLVSDNKE